jgi:pimeloyl-ACP methyl ester carboxylesterase
MPPDRQTDPTDAELRSARDHREHRVPRGLHRLYARDYPGQEPAVVLLHGFPDDLHLYDRLVPELAGRRVVSFDFLGWGASDKPTGYPASGPPAITWALDHPRQAAGLVLLNTYYADMPGLRDPQVIWLFSTPLVRSVARPVSRLFEDMVFRAMYRWQVGRFFRDPQVRQRFLPLLYRQFTATPSTHEAFFGLNRDLRHALAAGTAALPRLGRFDRPVRIIFGAADPYLNAGVARRFHQLFPTSELFLLEGARHYVQMDEPREVARLILGICQAMAPSTQQPTRKSPQLTRSLSSNSTTLVPWLSRASSRTSSRTGTSASRSSRMTARPSPWMPTAGNPGPAPVSSPLGLSPVASSPSSASSRSAICSALSPSTTPILNTQLIPNIPVVAVVPSNSSLGPQGSGSSVASGCDSLAVGTAEGAYPVKRSETTSKSLISLWEARSGLKMGLVAR